MFVPFDRRARVHLAVVALGDPARLQGCLGTLVAHESRHEFVVSCLVNRATMRPAPLSIEVPRGVRLERSAANLGWSGGLHTLRTLADSELLVWVQDDMLPEPGWLDALVGAADDRPSVGLFGALRVDEDGRVLTHNGGRAQPPDQVRSWNATDSTVDHTPTEVTLLDWVTSKGCLTRTRVFDEVGGPDPRLWPLNHVDKDYSTHVRCHGYDVALVPAARLRHAGSQSSPSSFREFLNDWRDGWFDERWAGPATALAGRTSGLVDHPCADWRTAEVGLVEGLAGREASAMLVPLARVHTKTVADLREQHETEVRSLQAQLADVERRRVGAEHRLADTEHRLAETHLRLAETDEVLRRVRRRAKRLRRRLRQVQHPPSLLARLSRRLRRLS